MSMNATGDAGSQARQGGLSLVELMVGLAVGLLVVLVVTSSLAVLNQQRKITVSGSDTQENAQAALSLLDRAGRLAGAGLFYNGQMLCSGINIYQGTVLADNASLMPVSIVDGGAAGSDRITFTYTEAPGGNGNVNVVNDMPTASSNFTVNHQGSLKVGDLAIIGVPGSGRPCTLFKVTSFPPGGGNCGGVTSSCIDIQHNPGVNGEYNPPNPSQEFTDAPRYGYENDPPTVIGPAIVLRAGKLVQDTYAVMCNSLLSYNATTQVPSCTSASDVSNATPLVADLVQIQAQYGITDAASSDVVTAWVNATGGSWLAPSAADIPRIKAIRIAVVARSRERAPSNVSGPCTNAAGVANPSGPCSFQDSEAPVIDLSGIPVPSGTTWRNFRYRVYQTVIPLRNVAWNY